MSEYRADQIPVDHDPWADPAAPRWDFASALAGTGQPAAANVPSWARPATMAELLRPGRDAVTDPVGNLTTDPTGLIGYAKGLAYLPAAIEDHRARLRTMYETGASPEQIADADRDNPLYNAAFSAVAGPLAGKALGAAGAAVADSPAGVAFGNMLSDESGALRFRATEAQVDLANTLRDQHLARPGNDTLPLIGIRPGKEPIQPPPHIQTMDDFNGLVDRYTAKARQGLAPAGEWYPESGQATLFHAGGDPEVAGKVVGGLSGTSQQTPVPMNLNAALVGHSQAMLGQPIVTGLFPNKMGGTLEGYYYRGEPVTGEKIGPFSTAQAEGFLPNLGGHSLVNDIWNMRALEYADPDGSPYSLSPSGGQHNFARIVANQAQDRLNAEGLTTPVGGQAIMPKHVQSSVWAVQKAEGENTPVAQAARSFADFLGDTYGQMSWESAPGRSSGHLPEYHDAPLEQQLEFHNDIKNVLTDAQGRFIPALHMGLLSGETLDAPGVWAGQVTPGSQSMIPLGQAPGGVVKTGGAVDPASRMLADATARATAILLRQDGAAWNRPFYAPNMAPETRNLAQFDIGRPPTLAESKAADAAMSEAVRNAGGDPGEFSPISTPTGFRYINNAEKSGLSHGAFQNLTDTVFQDHPDLPALDKYSGHADGLIERHDWTENPNGEGYLKGISATGSPGLQARTADLLAVLGPRISAIEEKFAQKYGWTPNRDTRIWETSPLIQQHGQALVPNPPRPWVNRPAPPGSGPSYFGGGPAGTVQDLIPVDHNPFAGTP